MDISADVLKELVFYDPVTGDFTLRKATRDKGLANPQSIYHQSGIALLLYLGVW